MASRANLVPGALDLTYRAAIKTIILVVSFILLYVVVKYVRADDIMIEPISVPPKLQEAGYSGAVVANLLVQEVRAIKPAGDELESGEANSKDTTLRPQSDDPFSTWPRSRCRRRACRCGPSPTCCGTSSISASARSAER